MLFDLRSRGRRRTVQVVYIGLAILIGSGLVLFGVGTGGSGGGLFGALTGSSSTSGGAAITSQTRKTPSSASAWASLVDARFSAANSVGYDSSTSTYTPAGKQQLTLLTVAYRRYLKLARTPTVDTITIAAHAYSQLDQYANAADAYQAVLQIQPGNLKGLECVSFLSYAAGNDDLAELAQAKVLGKLPKSARKEVKAQLQEAKTDKSVATESC
jgi:tetratricopeptide (TPR) repeat protein